MTTVEIAHSFGQHGLDIYPHILTCTIHYLPLPVTVMTPDPTWAIAPIRVGMFSPRLRAPGVRVKVVPSWRVPDYNVHVQCTMYMHHVQAHDDELNKTAQKQSRCRTVDRNHIETTTLCSLVALSTNNLLVQIKFHLLLHAHGDSRSRGTACCRARCAYECRLPTSACDTPTQ